MFYTYDRIAKKRNPPVSELVTLRNAVSDFNAAAKSVDAAHKSGDYKKLKDAADKARSAATHVWSESHQVLTGAEVRTGWR